VPAGQGVQFGEAEAEA
jgi:hypothetical protein